MKKLIVILLLYCPASAYAQGWSLAYSIGYGTYNLGDVRSQQQFILNRYGLKATDCFPGYVTHSVALGFVKGRHHFGSDFSYLTTGGRLHRADYSGSFTVDMIINGYRLGLFYRNYVNTGFSPLSVYFQSGSGVLFSDLEINEQLNIYSESAQEINILKGVGMYLEPSMGAICRFTRWLNMSLGAGYEADFLGTLESEVQETQFKAHWNGLRLYGGIVFVLPTGKASLNE